MTTQEPAAPYQLLPALTNDEFAALREDIAANGVRVPVDVDEEGVVLDGHHRLRLAAELGIDCPRRVVAGLTHDAKVQHAIAVNVHRRHLDVEQRRDLVARLRSEGLSVRRIAETTGIPKSTVDRDLARVPGGTPPPERVAGTDGKSYPSSRPASPTPGRPPLTAQEARALTDEIKAQLAVLPEGLGEAIIALGVTLDEHPELVLASDLTAAAWVATHGEELESALTTARADEGTTV